MYCNKALTAKPLTVRCSFLAILRINSASSRVQRMRMADLSVGMWRVQRRNLRQDSAGSLQKTRGLGFWGGGGTYLFRERKGPDGPRVASGLRFAQNVPFAVIRAGEDYPDGFILQVHGG